MVYDRQKAKEAIQDQDQNDPDLSSALNEGHKAYAEIAKIKNKHEIDKLNAERGWVGRLFGNWQNVPMFIALLSVLFGTYVYYALMQKAGADAADKQFWSESAKMALTFASTAVGYIFGRGSNDKDNA